MVKKRDKRSRACGNLTVTAILLLLAALLAVPVSCGSGDQAADQAGEAFSEETQQSIEKIITDAMAAENIPGVIVGVWVPGQGTWVGARGEADTATGDVMDPAFTVRIASNTKTYTATAVLQLVDEGLLSLEDTLDKYVPRIPNADRITVRQLLNMTGGIYSYSEDEEFGRVFDTEPLKVWTDQEILDIVLAHQPDFEPGAGWHYSDSNYYLLGMIIEQVTGNPVESEIGDRVIDRLGLAGTWFPTGPDMPGTYAHGYMPAGDNGSITEMTRIDPSAPWTGGAMVSNLEDMKTYVEALARGDLLSPAMQAERLQLVDVPESGIGYGLGIASIKGFLGHTGAINGYNSVLFSDPDTGSTLVVIANKSTNSSSEAVGIFIELGRLLFPERFPKAAGAQAAGGQEAAAGQQGDSGHGDQQAGQAGDHGNAKVEMERELHGQVREYPGSREDNSAAALDKLEEAGGDWILITRDALDRVAEFYRHELRSKKGFTEESSSGSVKFSFNENDGGTVTLVVTQAGSSKEDGTHVIISVSD